MGKLSERKVNGIILSAGFSSRMGSFKPLLNYKGKFFVISIIEKLYSVCDKIGIITGFRNNDVENEISQFISESNLNPDKIQIIYNPDFETGMFSSLQSGLKELSECNWLLYHFVDQPHILQSFYPEFIYQIDDEFNWIQPVFNQKKGHPILLHDSLYPNILDSKTTSLKNISHSSLIKKKIWNCNYPQIVEDIDTKDDYQKLT